MGQPLSMDLRKRLLAVIDAGMSCRSAALQFGVAPSTAMPVACAAARDRELCLQAPGWRYPVTPC
jgi:transposase